MILVLTTPPAAEPLDWDTEVKGHLRVDADDEETRVTTILVPAARQKMETFTRRAFIKQTVTLYLDRFPPAACSIELPRPPLLVLNSIKYYDGSGVLQTLSSGTYQVDPPAVGATPTAGAIDPHCQPWSVAPVYGSSWPGTQPRKRAVEIEYTCGYGTTNAHVPAALRAAMLLLVGEQFERREDAVAGTIIGPAELTAETLAWPFRVRLFAEDPDKPLSQREQERLAWVR